MSDYGRKLLERFDGMTIGDLKKETEDYIASEKEDARRILK